MEFDANLNPVEPPRPSTPFTPPPVPPTPPVSQPPQPRPPILPNGRGLGMLLGIVAVLAILAVAAMFALGNHSNPTGQMEGLTVSSDATVYAKPDVAKVNVGVVKTGKTVAEIETQLSDASTSIKTALTSAGVKDADIKTVDFNIYPQQSFSNNVSNITGYTGRHSMEVTIRDLNKTDEVLAAVTAAGANEVGQLNFTLENPESKLAEARKEALKKAKDKAKQIAQDGGFSLGRLVSVNEYTNQPIPMYGFGGTKDMGSGVTTPNTEPGSLTMQVNVTLVYKIR